MKDNSSVVTSNKLTALLSFIAIIYAFNGIFINNGLTGPYVGTIILASIILFLSLSTLFLISISEKTELHQTIGKEKRWK